MDDGSALGEILKRGEFCETDRERNSNMYDCLMWNIGRHPKRIALLGALLDHHRHGTPIPNDEDFELSCMESIIDACTSSMFAAIHPAIKSHQGIHAEFSKRYSSPDALKFVPSDQVDEYVAEYKLGMYDVTRAWTNANTRGLTTGPTLSQVLVRLRREKPSSHCFVPPKDVWLTPILVPGGGVEYPDDLEDVSSDEDTHHIYSADMILDPLLYDKDNDQAEDEDVLKELVDLYIGCLLSKEECQWAASIEMRNVRIFDKREFTDWNRQIIRSMSIALMKGWLDVQPAYWHLCPDEWNRYVDLVALHLADCDDGLRGFPYVFQECRAHLKEFVQERIPVAGLSELVCVYLIGDEPIHHFVRVD